MKREFLQIKKGNGVSPSKVESIYKKLGLTNHIDAGMHHTTVDELNEFVFKDYGFFNSMVCPRDNGVYTVEFTKTRDGLLYTVI